MRNLYSFLAIRHPNDILAIRRRLVVAGAINVSRGIIRRLHGLALGSLPHSLGVLKMADGTSYFGRWEQGSFVCGQAIRPGDLKCTGEVRPC
jgi:hypothetical protein